LISGCSTGFGRLLAERALKDGDAVAATARDVRSIEGLAAAHADRCACVPLDVVRGSSIRRCVQASVERFGRIDVLVNNAGYGYFSTQEEGDVDEFRRMLETNVVGLWRLTQAVLPGMRSRRSGTIVNLSSIAGRVAFPRAGFYNASKWAVEAMSEALQWSPCKFQGLPTSISPCAGPQ